MLCSVHVELCVHMCVTVNTRVERGCAVQCAQSCVCVVGSSLSAQPSRWEDLGPHSSRGHDPRLCHSAGGGAVRPRAAQL